jgi:hypothetical protein
MAALDSELNVPAFVSRDDTPDHRPVPRSILLRMPIEILRSVLLRLRDVSVAQPGYTQESTPSLSEISTTSPPGSFWIAVTHVCVGLREVALAMPELWTIIVLEDGVAWANVFAQRSDTMPISIHADCLRTAVHTLSLREGRERRREEVMILAAIPRFGARVSRLTAQGYALPSLQGLVDALDWSSLNLETLSLGTETFSRGVVLSLPRAFLDKQAPRLTSLDLRHVAFDFAQPWVAFSNLRTLSLQFLLKHEVATEQHTEVFCTWLKEMPLLEEISLFPLAFSHDISDSQWYGPVAATHPFLRRLSMTDSGSLLWTRSLATEISFPGDALVVSLNISFRDVRMSLDACSFQRLGEYLQRFWGRKPSDDATAGLDVKHVPTLRVHLNKGDRKHSEVALNFDRPGKPSHLRLHLTGSLERLLPALRTAFQQLLPLYTVEELRVHAQESLPSDFLSDASQLLDACRTLIVDGTVVHGLGLLPRLGELRVLNTERDDRRLPDPAPLLWWLRHRDDSGAPRLPLLIFEGAYRFQDAEHMADMSAIRLLVGDLRCG